MEGLEAGCASVPGWGPAARDPGVTLGTLPFRLAGGEPGQSGDGPRGVLRWESLGYGKQKPSWWIDSWYWGP